MRFWFFVLFVVLLHLTATAEVESCVPAEGVPLRIGAVFQPDSLLGADAADSYRGVSAMVEAVNRCGGAAGRPVELVLAAAGNHAAARTAVVDLTGTVSVVVGSGSAVVSEVLVDAAGEDTFFYWEVSEPLDSPHAYALSPRPNSFQLGAQVATFVKGEVHTLLDDNLRVALIYENNSRARIMAEGILQTLAEPPLMQHVITERWASDYQFAVQMRERRINVVIVAALTWDAERLWSHLRQADANPAAWVQVGSDPHRDQSCSRMGDTDGILSVSAAGVVNMDYRQSILAPIYAAYLAAYAEQYQRLPGERADLAASGMYILLREILSQAGGDTPAAFQQAAARTASAGTALMGEGWSPDGNAWVNQAASAIVSQRQNRALCTIAPGTVATCSLPLQRLPTWRDRARTGSC